MFARVLAAFAAVVALGAACSSTPERVPVPLTAPTAEPETSEAVVVTPPPSVTVAPDPTLADDLVASITTVNAGSPITDPAGNQIAMHAVRELPQELLVRPEDQLRIGQAAAIDISMCRAGAFATSDAVSVEFAIVDTVARPLANLDPLPGAVPLVAPGFAVPEPGTCARGWLAVRVDTSGGQVGRYVVAVADDDGIERHVYQWSDLDPDAPIDPAEQLFERGETVTFNDGSLLGTTIRMLGWAELLDAESPAGTRQVGVLAEVCPGTEDWPEFGLSVHGWNLVRVTDAGDRLGADPLAPLTGSCFEDWIEFAVPFGQRPTGFTASDGVDRVEGFAAWTLDGAAIDVPTLDRDG